MNNLANEQIRAILAATDDYKTHPFYNSIGARQGSIDVILKEILALRERVAEIERVLFDVREVLDSCDQACLGDASNSDGMVWAVRDEVINNISVALNKSATINGKRQC